MEDDLRGRHQQISAHIDVGTSDTVKQAQMEDPNHLRVQKFLEKQ